MIDRILEASLRQRTFVLLGALVLVVAGVWSALRLPIDAVPDITNVQVQINTMVPALAPEEIEKQITLPIEMEMAGVPGVLEQRSLSKFGLSQVTLIFEDRTDILRARQFVSERLGNLGQTLPPGVQPRLGPMSTGLGEIYYYSLDYGKGATNKPATRPEQLMELRAIQEFTIKPILRAVTGISDVNATGGYERQIVVQPDPEKLMNAGVAFEDLVQVLRESMENSGGGAIERGGEQVLVRGVGRVQTAEQIGGVPVKLGAGVEPILVRNLAEIGIGSSVRTGAGTEGGDEALICSVMMMPGENSRVVAHRVHNQLRDLRSKLPRGVEIRELYTRSDIVDRTIRTVLTNLFEGAILVMAILFLLLGNWRAALIVASAIPLSMLFAVTGMVQNKVSGNLMSLGAIDFGLIVDGAVVIVENVVRHMGERRRALGRALTKQEGEQTILGACRQVARPMFFGVLIIGIVYVPIFALSGVEGKMFKPMAFTVVFALFGAVVLALTLTPVLCSLFLNRDLINRENKSIQLATRLYESVLRLALRRRWWFVGAAVMLVLAAVLILPRLGAEFVPRLNEGAFTTWFIRGTSISLTASIDIQKRSERLLLEKFPEVTDMFARIGTDEAANDPMGVNVSDTYMMLRPRKEWRKVNGRPITEEQLVNLMTAELTNRIPGQTYFFSQPIAMRFNEMMEGVRSDIAVKIFGEDFGELEEVASEVFKVVQSIPGAEEVEFEPMGKAPLLEITLDRDALRRYNVHAHEVNDVIGAALAGERIGTFYEANRFYPIMVRLSENNRGDFEQFGRLPVRASDTGLLPLGKLAQFNVSDRVHMITRELGRRRAAIMVELEGRDVESFVREAQEKIKSLVAIPPGCSVEFGGQFKNLLAARARLMVVVPLALVLIFVLVFAAFGSLRQAGLIFLTVPLAASGGVFALAIFGMPFSISAAIGFIALSGIAVLNGLVLITFFNQLRQAGRPIGEVVLEGALTRLRPMLMTALVASLGFVPMAIATGAGAEVQRPLATVVIGGIISSTFLTLVLLPTLYEWIEKRTGTGNTEASTIIASEAKTGTNEQYANT
ncbi:MAG TPA: CusA/CzcA family heavy metal efflux RND transporter [Verrucomicrobiae bacterium]|nr:CusA/CzcA family heavy metal efflux RND transporter [Verrucomicrobiae bacterium]